MNSEYLHVGSLNSEYLHVGPIAAPLSQKEYSKKVFGGEVCGVGAYSMEIEWVAALDKSCFAIAHI